MDTTFDNPRLPWCLWSYLRLHQCLTFHMKQEMLRTIVIQFSTSEKKTEKEELISFQVWKFVVCIGIQMPYFFWYPFSFNNFRSVLFVLFRFRVSCHRLTDDDWQWYQLITSLVLFMLWTNPMDYKTDLSHCCHTICNNCLHYIRFQVSPLRYPMMNNGTSC
jgi:hypothetical protein